MNLEQLSIRLRRRKPWEAADLGLAMVRHWRNQVFRPWLVVTLPLALVLILGLGGWGCVLFWWLLPMAEAAVLHAVSRAVFGAPPEPRDTIRALPSLWRGIVAELLIRRLHPNRALRLPVNQLEGLSGATRRRRATSLETGEQVAVALPFLFLLFEVIVCIGFVGLVLFMTPDWVGIDWSLQADRMLAGASSPWLENLIWLLIAGSLIVLHPFYMGAAFGIYLDRRTVLEGWDLEIAFRRLALRQTTQRSDAPRRQPKAAATAGSHVAVIVAASLLWLVAPQSIHCQETEPVISEAAANQETDQAEAPTQPPRAVWNGRGEDPREAIREVMNGPDLRRTDTRETWRWRWPLESDLEPQSTPSPIGAILAAIAEPLMWLGGFTLLALLVMQLLKSAAEIGPAKTEGDSFPKTIAGLDVDPQSLPDNVSKTASDLWTRGRRIEALSLLYRGALIKLIDQGLALRESATEDDCQRAVQSWAPSQTATYFARLTSVWQVAAYGHRLPESTEFTDLSQNWPSYFEDATTVPENAVPEDAVLEDAVPENAVPENAVPEDTVLEDTVLEDTAVDFNAIEEPAVQDSAALGNPNEGANARNSAASAPRGTTP